MGVADFPEQPAVFIPNKRPISAKYASRGEVALFAADARPLTINLLPIRFQDHAQGIAHYLQTPRIGYYSIDLTGVPQGVQAVQVCHPLDIADYGGEGSSVLLLGNAQLICDGPKNVGLGGNGNVFLLSCLGFFHVNLLITLLGVLIDDLFGSLFANFDASTFVSTFRSTFGSTFVQLC